tara:strand:+ start:114 stop:455 length:342 start_codon:yes stop_codon:yes gene_type:complete
MSDAFKDRERGEEFRFEISQEIEFKTEARRNRLLGEWLAHKFGLTKDDAAAYIKAVISSDLEEPGVEDVVRKVMKDIEDRGAAISEEDVRSEMDRLYAVAAEQVQKGFKSDTL